MTTTGARRSPAKPYITDWRAAIENEVERLRLLRQRQCPEKPTPAEVDEALDTAWQAVSQSRSVWDRVKVWWSGWDAERGWHAVHRADVELVSNSADLASRLPGIRGQVAKELSATDPCLQALDKIDAKTLDNAEPGKAAAARAVVAEAMRAAYAVADDALRSVRILRNQMLVFGAVLTILNLTLGILGSMRPELIPLCTTGEICPSGPGTAPTGGDIWTIQMLGVLGAVIAVVWLLVNSPPQLITYGLTGYQSLVKITLGGTLAVVGVLGVAAGAFETLINSQASLLFAALVFGYAQQVATRSLDNAATRLVGKAKTGTTKANTPGPGSY